MGVLRRLAGRLISRGIPIAIAVAATVLAMSLVTAGAQPGSQQNTAVRLNPASAQLNVGGTQDVNIEVVDVGGLYGAQLTLAFSPTILQVVDANPATPDVIEISPGPLFTGGFVAQNSASNVSGTINFAATKLAPQTAFTGTGTLATVRFQGNGQGSDTVLFTDVLLSDQGGNPIAATTQSGTYTVTASGEVRGSVVLQGRTSKAHPTSHAGVDITISDGVTYTTSTVKETNLSSAFTVTNVQGGTYTVTVQMSGYLSARRGGVVVTAGQVTQLPAVTMLAGDVNGDGFINILDLTGAAVNFGKSGFSPWP